MSFSQSGIWQNVADFDHRPCKMTRMSGKPCSNRNQGCSPSSAEPMQEAVCSHRQQLLCTPLYHFGHALLPAVPLHACKLSTTKTGSIRQPHVAWRRAAVLVKATDFALHPLIT